MSRNMTVRFGRSYIALPIHQVDRILAPLGDNPTFGNVREMYARNCYLKHLHLKKPIRAVLDLGANRGMFSLLALLHLEAEVVVGVEPQPQYDEIFKILLEANQSTRRRAPRYLRLVGSSARERSASSEFVSIATILREQAIQRFDLVKMDIEGGEKELFGEPDWLSRVDNLTMELHPQFAGDLSLIPAALEEYGLNYRLMDQQGKAAGIDSAMFLVASREALRD